MKSLCPYDQEVYLSHGSAACLHGLITELDHIYVNQEQTPKPPVAGTLSQEAMDRAFSNVARTSQYVFEVFGRPTFLLSGKHTGDFQVLSTTSKKGELIRHTSLERTLFDIAVRPAYAGGASKVLDAYRSASKRLSVKRLLSVIAHIDHLYPYHQAIGYYLQHAGFAMSDLKPLKALGVQFRFYLENRMKKPVLDSEWNIYVPPGLV